MAFATTAITSSAQGCGGPGGGGGGVVCVGEGGGVVDEDDGTAVSDMLGGGLEDDAAAALVGTAGWSSDPKSPTIQITSSSVTSAAPIAAMRRRQYTVDGSGPVGSITARR
ncbi:hypothetical protein GCM10010178_77050 [Lentzea flava]|uniref:Uncharacterized protein n=1 Tax=Lentzea flava TaxID=103732 RepID=A0ABQ2VB25_9PSEU|nr:hypothetical protein GCM10010178_77050 [Lentzea flava]